MTQPTREVAPGIYRLGNELFNWYLIRDQQRFTLVDGGLPGYWHQLRSVLGDLNASIEDIDAVLITHAHLDHLGLVERVRRESGATVYMHPADTRRAARGGAQIPPKGLLANAWRRMPFRILSTAARKGVFFGRPVRKFTPLQVEGPLEVPGQPLVLFVPGHTLGSVAFWLPDRKALLAGDALVTVDMVATQRTGPHRTPRGTNDDEHLANASLSSFESLGEAVLLTGHGDPWKGEMSEAVAQARGVSSSSQS
jgi:glyoxylase-like metal-dependent hydrolase (beta-lactamase superfamily II)